MKTPELLIEQLKYFLISTTYWLVFIYLPPWFISNAPTAPIQLFGIILSYGILQMIVKVSHFYYERIDNLLYTYVVIVAITALTLGAFSQSELSDLGFIFSEKTKTAAVEYLLIKLVFNLIGMLGLPSALKLYSNREPLISKIVQLIKIHKEFKKDKDNSL